jgi:hypothetical protein
MLFLPMATFPLEYPMAFGTAPEFPSRCKRRMRKGAWPPDRAPFSCAAARITGKKCPRRWEISQGLRPGPFAEQRGYS